MDFRRLVFKAEVAADNKKKVLNDTNMKFGIKIWSTNIELIRLCRANYEQACFDYIEITAVRGSYNENQLEKLKGIPTVVHCDNFGVDLANPSWNKTNTEGINESRKVADYLGSKYIVLHPGYNDGMNTAKNIDIVNRFLKNHSDERFCMENMPPKNIHTGVPCLCREYEELMQLDIVNYCLDFAHASQSASFLSVGTYDFIGELTRLNPVMYHISDVDKHCDKDEHLDIGMGTFDFKILFSYMKKMDTLMTLETPKSSYKSLDDDIRNINKLKKCFK